MVWIGVEKWTCLGGIGAFDDYGVITVPRDYGASLLGSGPNKEVPIPAPV